MRNHKCSLVVLCVVAGLALASCGFHLRRSAALPAAMQRQVYLRVNGGGEFPRSLASALSAGKVEVLDAPAEGVATLAVPEAVFSSRLLTTGGVQRVGEYAVTFQVRFTLTGADGKTLIPAQTITLSHEFAVDQTQLTAISSETEAIQRSLVREMTDAVMRRLEARADTLTASPVSGSSAAGAASAASAG